MNSEKSRKERALEKIEQYKQYLARDRAEIKKAVAKAKRDAKKAMQQPSPSKVTFGSSPALGMAAQTSREGFVYRIKIGSYIYVGKKSFRSTSKWQTYRSSSKQVKRLIAKAIAMGVTPIYEVIEICDSKWDLAKAETRHIHAQWSTMAMAGKLSLSLNMDNGTGTCKRDEWAAINGHFSQIIR